MSYPILYNSTETSFDHNGIGILSACISCEVTEETNGKFELSMQYPMDGIHFDSIIDRAIIKAKADQFREPQLFRVYSINKTISGIVKVSAQHISYDLSGIPVYPFNTNDPKAAMARLKTYALVDCPFDFETDIAATSRFEIKKPTSVRSALGGIDKSIVDVYGGEYEFDNFTVKLHSNRGLNRGVTIKYGKNLTDINQEQNCSSLYTGVYPFWINKDANLGSIVTLPEKIVNASGTYNFVKILTLDLSSAFEFQPTIKELRAMTQKYIEENGVGVPAVSLTVSFAQLEQSEEYKHLKLLERVSLCDTVSVEFPALGVSATAKAVKLIYDVINDRVKSITLGSARVNIGDTIANQQKEIEKKPNKDFMQTAIESLTKTILGAQGGSVRFLDNDNDGEPDTLYIANDPDPMKATKVWRFNYEGWGASVNGYSGPFIMGATFDEGLVSDRVTAGTLKGWLFKAGMIESLYGEIQIDLSSGSVPIFNTGIQTNKQLTVMDKDGQNTIMSIGSKETNGIDHFDFNAYDEIGGYDPIFRITRLFDASNNPAMVLELANRPNKGNFFVDVSGQSALVSVSGNRGDMTFGVHSLYGACLLLPGDTTFKSLSWKNNGDGTHTLIGR